MNIADLPFNSFIGISRSDREGFVLSLPNDKKYTNHLGTVHASALVALAEATSGECLVDLSGKMDFEVIPLVRRIESKFRKPAVGSIHSRYILEEDRGEAFLDQLARKGRAILSVGIEVYDGDGTFALNATVDWFVSKK